MFEVRIADAEDLPRLLELDREFWQERMSILDEQYRHTEAPMPEEIMFSRISGDNFRTFLVLLEKTTIGYLVAVIRENILPSEDIELEGRICDLYVCPEHRRKGAASLLYEKAREWFAENGCVCEGLTVYSANPAHFLYQKWGFADFSVNMKKRRNSINNKSSSL